MFEANLNLTHLNTVVILHVCTICFNILKNYTGFHKTPGYILVISLQKQ
jgi:hypothetical protein